MFLPCDTLILLPLHIVSVGPGDGINEALEVRIAEVSDAVSCRVDLCRRRRLDDTMLRALNSVVRPSREQVAGVDHDGVFDRRRIDEVPVRREDLKAASLVLEELHHLARFASDAETGSVPA